MGNQYAMVRAMSHYAVEYALSEACSGVTGYKFLCGLLEQADWAALGKNAGSSAGKGAAPRGTDHQPPRQRSGKSRSWKLCCPAVCSGKEARGTAKPYTQELTAR